jgi:hypothetical protein
VRKEATYGLARKAGAEEVNILLRALRDDHRNPGVLNSALQVLALGGIDAIVPLTEFLNDPDADLRIYATHALGDQHDPRAVPVLVRALEDENPNVRYHAIEALGKLRAADAVDALAHVAASGDFFLAFPALDALTLIGDSRIAPRLAHLLEDDMLRSPAIDALGKLGDEEIVAPLAALLNSQSALAIVTAQALAALHDRYERFYQEGAHIADLAREAVNREGVQNLLDAVDAARGDTLAAAALVNLSESSGSRSAHSRGSVLQGVYEDGGYAVVVEVGYVFYRGAAHALFFVAAPFDQQVGALVVAEVACDLHHGFAHSGVRVIEQRARSLFHFGMAERVDGGDHGLSHRRVFVADQIEQSLEGATVSDLSERARDRDDQLGVFIHRFDKRGHGPRVSYATERDDCRLARLNLIVFKLLDQQFGYALAVAHEGFDHFLARGRLAEQSHQSALDRFAFKPA